MKVLIVEDSPVICERLRGMVAGFRDVEVLDDVNNEADAIRDISSKSPELVILDLTLAQGSGIEVLNQVKKQGFIGKVVVFTNYAYPQYRKKCLDLGADYFLDKSLDLEILGQLIAKLAQESCSSSNCSSHSQA